MCKQKPNDGLPTQCHGRPDAVVVGVFKSTLACAIVAKKAGVPVAPMEAGLHSGDMACPMR